MNKSDVDMLASKRKNEIELALRWRQNIFYLRLKQRYLIKELEQFDQKENLKSEQHIIP
jgi:hypothetical protein